MGEYASMPDARSIVMAVAQAITLKKDNTSNLLVLTASFFMSIIVLDLVSLLIGGVLRPLLTEW